jgi:hypothetical protein
MSFINRITTWATNQILTSSALNSEFNNIINLINNVDAGTTTWDNVKVTTLTLSGNAVMGGFKLTGLGNGTASGDSATFGQVQGSAGYSNILINGGFEIWQRGTSFSLSTAGTFTADRLFYEGMSGSSACVISRESTTIHDGTYAAKIDITNIGTATSLGIVQKVENYLDYAGKTVTFSQWVKTSLSGIRIGINDGSITQSSAHAGDGNWQQLTVTKTISATPAFLYFYNYYSPSAPPLGIVYIDSAMAVVNSIYVDYFPRPFGEDLALCQRYYEKSYDISTVPATSTTTNRISLPFNVSGSNVVGWIPYHVTKRVAPTVIFYTFTGTAGSWDMSGGITTVTNGNNSTNGCLVVDGISTDTFGEGHFTADAEL